MKYTHINNIPRTFESYKLKPKKTKIATIVGAFAILPDVIALAGVSALIKYRPLWLYQ